MPTAPTPSQFGADDRNYFYPFLAKKSIGAIAGEIAVRISWPTHCRMMQTVSGAIQSFFRPRLAM
jgi:hypothetical protein